MTPAVPRLCMGKCLASVLVVALLALVPATCLSDDVEGLLGEYGVDALAAGGKNVDALRSLVVAKYNPRGLGDRYNAISLPQSMPAVSQGIIPQQYSNITPSWLPEYLQQNKPAGFGGFDCTSAP